MGAVRIVFAVTALAGCGRIGFAPLDPPEVVTLDKLYPVAGRGWNDLVARTPGADDLHAADVPCANTFDLFYDDDCIHGGERLTVAIPSARPCDGLVYGDALGAFDWICTSDGGELRFYSLGFAPQAGLTTLVDETGWKPNHFEVRDGGRLAYVTRDEAWWDNPVVPLPDNSAGGVVVLDAPGTIYTLAASRASNGYSLDADRIGLVTLGDAVLSYAGGAALNCDTGPAGTGTPANPKARCLIAAPPHTAQWIEGRFDGGATGTPSDEGLYLHYPIHAVLRHVTASHHALDGVYPEYGSGDLLVDITAVSNGRDGIHDHYDHTEIERGVVVANNGNYGIFTYDGGPWRITDVKTFNNGAAGVFMDFGPSGEFTDILAVGNGGPGFAAMNSWYAPMVLHGITAIDNTGPGIAVSALDGATGTHLVAINNGDHGIGSTDYNDASSFAQLVSAQNAGYGVYLAQANNSLYAGNLVLGTNTTGGCMVVTGQAPGLDNTCASAANLVTGITVDTSFVGPIASDDGANASDAAGAAPAGTITDWTHFDGAFRVWGRDAAALDASARGRCGPTDTCRIWDFALAAGDTALRDAVDVGSPHAEPFVAGAPCPTAVRGDVAMTNTRARCDYPDAWPTACQRVYLLDARELVGDHVGDDDGLCESDEACVYTPNFGADQGSGPLAAGTCVFQDGLVHGVQMHGR